MNTQTTSVRIVRWVARIWSLLSIILIGVTFVGELFSITGPTPTPIEWLGLLFFPFGVLVGLGLGWWREGVGGATAVFSLFAFYMWDFVVSHSLPGGIFFLLLTAPAFLYLFVWQQMRQEPG